MDPSTRDWLVAPGCAPLLGIAEGLGAIRHAIWWGERRRDLALAHPAPLQAPTPNGPIRGLTEAESKARLVALGLPVPASGLTSAAGLAEAARSLRFPVALKMIGPRLQHKSEAGAVALGIADAAALTAAAEQMIHAVRAYDPAAVTDAFLIEEMAPRPVAELLISLRRDPEFGPALTLAAGGVLVEVLRDTADLLLPASPGDIRTAIDGLRISRLLRGYRGGAAADVDALAATILRLQNLILADTSLIEIEINPAFVGAKGTTIVDALIHVRA
jgi:hypothetical protein